MTDTNLNLLEKYILSENKDDFITKMLISGTDDYYFYYLMNSFHKNGARFEAEDEQKIGHLLKSQDQRVKKVRFRYYLQKYLNAKESSAESKAALSQINKEFFGFNFEFVSDVQVSKQLVTGAKQLSDSLDESLTLPETYLSQAYKDDDIFRLLSPAVLRKADVALLLQSGTTATNTFLSAVGEDLAAVDGIADFLVSHHKLQNVEGRFIEFDKKLFPKLTVQQLEQISTALPTLFTNMHFVGELFLKKFGLELSRLGQRFFGQFDETSTKLEQQEKLKEVLHWLEKLPHKFESFQEDVVYELLHLAIETNRFDFELFIRYLKSPHAPLACSSKAVQEEAARRHREGYWEAVHEFERARWLENEQVVELFLERYFLLHQKPEDCKPLLPFLEEEYLRRKLHETLLVAGRSVENVTEMLGADYLEQVKTRKLMTILKSNKNYFLHGEEVALRLEIKNVSSLTVKVFEFSGENYYLKTLTELSSAINLEGLVASETQAFHFDEPPILKFEKLFRFKRIAEQRQGVFIVEFIGGGLTSRAIVRKGGLTTKEECTIAGLAVQILDERFERCNGPKTGIWIQGKFYK